MSIAYTTYAPASEEHHSFSERLDLFGEHSAEVTIRVPWADRYEAAAGALGNAEPQLGIASVVCLEATITPFPSAATVDGQGLVYEDALIKLKYGTVPGGASATKTDPVSGEEVIVTESLEPTIEYLKLDPKGFRWTSADGRPLKENEAPSREMRGMNLVRAVQNMETLDTSILTLAGKTNTDAYASTLLGITFPAETLLWVPPSLRRTVKADGTDTMSVVLKLAYKEKGWNKFWRADKSGDDKYDTIFDIAANAQYKNFPPASMTNWLY